MNQSSNPMDSETTADMELDVKIEDPRDKRRARRQPQQAATVRGGGEPGEGDANGEDIDEIEEEIVLKYGAAHVIKLFIPVTLCLIFVILSLSLIKSYQKSDGATL